MARKFILPYKMYSSSARALSRATGIKRIRLNNSRYRPRQSDLVINWGNSNVRRHIGNATCLNEDTIKSTDKLLTMQALEGAGVSIPQWTTDEDVARSMAEDGIVVCRTMLRAHSGRGIVLAHTADDVVTAPLYTKYVKKKHEYRVHIFLGQEVDRQRKMRRADVSDEDINWQVRNHANGFIYGRECITDDSRLTDIATAAIAALGLDFGAVDIIYNEHQDRYYVLEVNTACGLTGTTLSIYSNLLMEL